MLVGYGVSAPIPAYPQYVLVLHGWRVWPIVPSDCANANSFDNCGICNNTEPKTRADTIAGPTRKAKEVVLCICRVLLAVRSIDYYECGILLVTGSVPA